MAKKISGSVGKGGKNSLPGIARLQHLSQSAVPSIPAATGLSASVRLKLGQAGMTDSGIGQLAAGFPVSNTKDREIVRHIVAVAMNA